MHLSDTLVLGPVPPFKRTVRMRLAGLLLILGMALLATALVLAITPAGGAALVDGLPSLVGVRATPVPQPKATLRIDSQPSGAAILVDGRDAGVTPSTISVPMGSVVVLRRIGFLDTQLADRQSPVNAALWGTPAVQTVRPPLPGGKIAGVDVLADGRIVLDVTVPTAPSERQAWAFDPAASSATRLGPTTLVGPAPAGVAVAPDGARTVSLVRGAAPTNAPQLGTQPTPAESLRLDGPDGGRSFVVAGSLVAGERVLDLTWPPAGNQALLLSQHPVAGGSRFRLRRVDEDGSVHDLVDLPLEPVEASWVWGPDGQRVAFLVRAEKTTLTLATLDLGSGALSSVADIPADALPAPGGLAPANWLDDGTLVLAAPVADDGLTSAATPEATRSSLSVTTPVKPPTAFGLYALPANQATPHRVGTTQTVAAAPVELPDGSIAALARDAHDGTLLLQTFDRSGGVLTEQRLALRAPTRFSIRWDLVHSRAVMLLPAEGGGIDVRVVAFGREAGG